MTVTASPTVEVTGSSTPSTLSLPTPASSANGLTAASCQSASLCMAGEDQGNALSWDGTD